MWRNWQMGMIPVHVPEMAWRQEFLDWIGDAVKEKAIEIPDKNYSIRWKSFKMLKTV